jgi:4-amino-4-deoxy-L-arabinose transferase-like glycosyltransferase
VGLPHRPYRFLVCWFAAYLVFFSAAATKLPNYMLPVYPALAVLTARFLVRWRGGDLVVPEWLMRAGVAGVVLTAVAVGGALLVADGVLGVLPAGARVFPGLRWWALASAIPLAAAVVMTRAARENDRARFVRAMAAGSVAFTALLAAFAPLAVDARKAPRELVRASGVDNPDRDLRLARFDWFQPSVVFYARREVVELKAVEQVTAFFLVPTPAYLFVPAPTWDGLVQAKVPVPTRIVARHHDFLRNCEILVVTSDVTATAGR